MILGSGLWHPGAGAQPGFCAASKKVLATFSSCWRWGGLVHPVRLSVWRAFGTLGEYIGMHALWFDRTSPEHVLGLLIMTVAVGAVHVTLGLILGVWEAIKDKSRNHLLERGGMLVGLIGLFFMVGVLTDFLPQGFMSVAIAIIIVGIVLLSASLGCLGIVMGPIEFITLVGNVLSYLRIAAIGLASVYLAKVANEVAGIAGNVVVGAILAILIHALNLVRHVQPHDP